MDKTIYGNIQKGGNSNPWPSKCREIEKKMMTLVLNAARTPSAVLIAGGSTCHSHFTSETESQYDVFSSELLDPFFLSVKFFFVRQVTYVFSYQV